MNIWKNIKIIKSVGKGANGETFLIELNNKQYALKKQKILENEKDIFNNEIQFFNWIEQLNVNKKKFFMQLYHYRIDNNCNFDFTPLRGYISDEHKKSKLCFDMILELKENTIDKIIKNLSKKQVISAFIQMLYAFYLMQKSGYYHFDAKTDNITCEKTNNSEIDIGKFGKIFTFGYKCSVIDYGSVLHKDFTLDEFDKKMLDAQMYFNADLILLVDYMLLRNEEIYSQIQENKIHLKSKEAYDFFSKIPEKKFNKIKKFMEEKLNVNYIDMLKTINSDNAKKEPKYMFAIDAIIRICRIKYPKLFIKILSKQFDKKIIDNQKIFDKKELLYIIKNQNKLHKIIKYMIKKYFK
jgi:hypothetical protein